MQSSLQISLLLFLLSLILLICSVVIYFVGKIPGLSSIIWILNLVVLVYAIIGIINAFKGQEKELPFIGQFRIIQ